MAVGRLRLLGVWTKFRFQLRRSGNECETCYNFHRINYNYFRASDLLDWNVGDEAMTEHDIENLPWGYSENDNRDIFGGKGLRVVAYRDVSNILALRDQRMKELEEELEQAYRFLEGETGLKVAFAERCAELENQLIESRSTNRELNRRNGELHRALNLESGRKAWYGYYQAAFQLFDEAMRKKEELEHQLEILCRRTNA